MLEYNVEIATSKGVESNFLFHWLWDIVVLVPFRASATDACHLKVSCFETETPRTRTWQGVQAEIAGTIIVKSMRGSNCEGIEFILFLSWSDPIARGFPDSTGCFRLFPGCFSGHAGLWDSKVLISCRWISCSEGGRAPYRNRREAGNHCELPSGKPAIENGPFIVDLPIKHGDFP